MQTLLRKNLAPQFGKCFQFFPEPHPRIEGEYLCCNFVVNIDTNLQVFVEFIFKPPIPNACTILSSPCK